ncbi:hypothetical protein RB195_002708 [Necator americanus]
MVLSVVVQHNQAKLVFVAGLWTHGDRAPGNVVYPNDINDESSWPRGFGALTNRGLKKMYNLGQWLRERYVKEMKLLSPNNIPREVSVQSSDLPVTVESAQAVMAGLFPAEGNRIWADKGLTAWQPFYIHTAADSLHDMARSYSCPLVDSTTSTERSELKRKFDKKHSDLLKRLGIHTGLAPVNFFVLTTLYGIQTEIDHGLPQPEWINETYEGKKIIDWIREVKTIARASNFNSKQKAHVRAGVLLSTWIKYLQEAAHNKGPLKAVFGSTHDGTVFPLMYAMGISDGQLVQPGSLFLVELHKEESDHLVRLWWRNSTDHIYQLSLPSCELDCPLEDFVNQLRPVMLDMSDVEEALKKAIWPKR